MFVDAAGVLLEDNAMHFFPAYTNHGVRHVRDVLATAVELVPEEVWVQELLTDRDAAVLVCACVLHDLAMHLQPTGFVSLVTAENFQPVRWFNERHGTRPADMPWSVLWARFCVEARHLDRSELERIIGPDANETPRVVLSEHLDPPSWQEADILIIGEFLRRHHPRLAHETALQGLPGLPSLVPEMLAPLPDIVGLVARSHGESLRHMLEYLRYRYGTGLQPARTSAVYLMGLLRVADYLQIESSRAPAALMHLKNPPSRQSIDEWTKHAAVATVTADDEDPRAARALVTASHGLRTHLQLRALFEGLQAEMDTTSAILSETYGRSRFAPLELQYRRVVSNIDTPAMEDELPYVPLDASLRSGDDLFRLLVGVLYGREPAVAGRELLQNAVDAVKDRRRLPQPIAGEAEGDEPDVTFLLDENESGAFTLRVRDHGVGMTPEVVADYFLRAGASYRPSPSDLAPLDPAMRDATARGGRFGIGAFSAFLLGDTISVMTRHVTASRAVHFTVSFDEALVEMRWADAPVGTEVTVAIDPAVIQSQIARGHGSAWDFLDAIAGLYWLTEPRVDFVLRDCSGNERRAHQDVFARVADGSDTSSTWRSVDVPHFGTVLWTPPTHGTRGLAHNGIAVRRPKAAEWQRVAPYVWTHPSNTDGLERPALAVFDVGHRLPLTLDRYGLADETLQFEEYLLRSIGLDLAVHALLHGDAAHPLDKGALRALYGPRGFVPALPNLVARFASGPVLEVDLWGVSVADTTAFVRRTKALGWRVSGEGTVADLVAPGMFRNTRRYLHERSEVWQKRNGLQVQALLLARRSAESIAFRRFARPLAGAAKEQDGVLAIAWGQDGEPWSLGDEALERLEQAAVIWARSERKAAGIAVALLAQREPPPSDALAEAWLDVIGGELDQDEERRIRQLDAALDRFPQLEVHRSALTARAQAR
jgi:hypothetical protein